MVVGFTMPTAATDDGDIIRRSVIRAFIDGEAAVRGQRMYQPKGARRVKDGQEQTFSNSGASTSHGEDSNCTG